jgi:hypothetical protein
VRLLRERTVFGIMCTLHAVVLRAGLGLCCITEGSSGANILKPSCILYGTVSQNNIQVLISSTLNASTVTRVSLCRITEESSGANILKPSCILYGTISQNNIQVRISSTLNTSTVTQVCLRCVSKESSGTNIFKPLCYGMIEAYSCANSYDT